MTKLSSQKQISSRKSSEKNQLELFFRKFTAKLICNLQKAWNQVCSKSIEKWMNQTLQNFMFSLLFVGHKSCSTFALKRKYRKRATFIGLESCSLSQSNRRKRALAVNSGLAKVAKFVFQTKLLLIFENCASKGDFR